MILIYAAPRRTSKAILLKPYKPASILARKHETVGPLIKNSVLNIDVGASHEQATRLLGANQRASAADLDRLFRVPSTADLHERVSLRGSLPAHR